MLGIAWASAVSSAILSFDACLLPEAEVFSKALPSLRLTAAFARLLPVESAVA